MDASFFISAFVAGVLTFLAPCTLPFVPGYLGFISGASLDDLKDPARSKRARGKIFLNGVFFIIGFSAVFIAIGTLIGFVGASVLGPYRTWLARVGGVFVILFGLFMLGIFKIPFFAREARWKAPTVFERGKPLNSFILGSAFASGWTPCVGPILGSILLLASRSTTALQGGILLAVFSMGLAVPFLGIALGIGSASRSIGRLSGFLNIISLIGGIFLIFLGVLLVTGNMGFLVSWGYQLFRFIDYEGLLNYL